jgi:hypothetical protein
MGARENAATWGERYSSLRRQGTACTSILDLEARLVRRRPRVETTTVDQAALYELKCYRETAARPEPAAANFVFLSLEVEDIAEEASPFLLVRLAMFERVAVLAVLVVVVVVVAATVVVVVLVSMFPIGDRYVALCGLRRTLNRVGFLAERALDDLIKLSSIQPDSTASGAIIDFNALSFGHQ